MLRPLSLLFLLALLLLPPIARAGEDLADWSTERLWEEGLGAYRQGNCHFALQSFRQLLSRDLSPELHAGVLYQQAVCFEQGTFLDEAAFNYQYILSHYAHLKTAQDALFRLGRLAELQGHYAQAERRFRQVLRRYGDRLSPPDRRAVQVQIHYQELRQGHTRQALRGFQALIQAWEAIPREEWKDERFYIAKARFALGVMLSQFAASADFNTRPLSGGPSYLAARLQGRVDDWLARRLHERLERNKAARYQYEEAMAQRAAPWLCAAHYRLGEDAEDFYRSLLQAPIPPTLKGDERQRYQEKLQEQAREVLLNASQLYHRGLELAVETSDEGPYVERLREKVTRMEAGGLSALGQGPREKVWW